MLKLRQMEFPHFLILHQIFGILIIIGDKI
jgi:hypothetical protein